MELNPQYPLILNEIDRLIAQFKNTPGIETYISMASLEERQRQLKSFTQSTRIKVKNPFVRQRDLSEGTIAWRNGKMMHKTVTGTWRPVEEEEKEHLLGLVLKEGPSPSPEFLLAWIAQTTDGAPINEEWIRWALVHDSLRVRFVGLHILELKPSPKYLPLLLEHWQQHQPPNYAFSELFGTLESALFGLPERNLLAIRSLVRQYRQTALKLFHSNKALPASERAWVLAELRDTNLVYRYYDMVEQGRTPWEVSIGLYASYLTTPKKALWLLNKNLNHTSPTVSCVAQTLLSLEQETNKAP